LNEFAIIVATAFAMIVPFMLLAKPGWRAAFMLVIPVGFLQEPIRKSIEGQPVSVQLAAVAAFGLAMLAAISKFGFPTLRPLTGLNRNRERLLILFFALICLQSVHSLVRFGTFMVPLLGLLSYLLPIPALWVAHQFVTKPDDIRRYLLLYMMAAFVMTLGVILNYRGYESPLFEQVGDAPMIVYHQAVGVVELYCGLLRSPEVAAWHAAALGCFSVIVAFSFKGMLARFLCPVFLIYAFFTISLTGRRKAFAIMVLFGAIYLLGLILTKRRTVRAAAIVASMIAGMVLAAVAYISPESSGPSPHMDRTATAFDDAGERFTSLGLGSVLWGYNAGGLFGLGTGAGAQGSQHIAGVRVQGSAEGGLGRIILELGPLGLILAVLCSIAVAVQARRCAIVAANHSPEMTKVVIGLLAFIGANVPIFIGAAQIFGDPFVLIILGTQLGFVLAAPRMIQMEHRRKLAGQGGNAPRSVQRNARPDSPVNLSQLVSHQQSDIRSDS
jgi:hypothetical protein